MYRHVYLSSGGALYVNVINILKGMIYSVQCLSIDKAEQRRLLSFVLCSPLFPHLLWLIFLISLILTQQLHGKIIIYRYHKYKQYDMKYNNCYEEVKDLVQESREEGRREIKRVLHLLLV